MDKKKPKKQRDEKLIGKGTFIMFILISAFILVLGIVLRKNGVFSKKEMISCIILSVYLCISGCLLACINVPQNIVNEFKMDDKVLKKQRKKALRSKITIFTSLLLCIIFLITGLILQYNNVFPNSELIMFILSSMCFFLVFIINHHIHINAYPLNNTSEFNLVSILKEMRDKDNNVTVTVTYKNGKWYIDDEHYVDLKWCLFPRLYLKGYFIRNLNYEAYGQKFTYKKAILGESWPTFYFNNMVIYFVHGKKAKKYQAVKKGRTVIGYLVKNVIHAPWIRIKWGKYANVEPRCRGCSTEKSYLEDARKYKWYQ